MRPSLGSALLGALAAIVTAGAPLRARALEWSPEFQSLTETEQELDEGPWLFASEYSADVLSYRRPDEWQYQWLASRNAYDMAFGSVGAAHFVIDQRVKLQAELSEGVEFRFNYFQEKNRERDASHAMLEFAFWPSRSGERKLGFALYGEPELYKRNNDTGIALLFRPGPRHEIRAFNTFVDVTRLKRSDRLDNHVPPYLPYSRGLVGRWWSDPERGSGEFFEYAFRYDTRTQWTFPSEQYLYEYWNALGSIHGRKKLHDELALSLRVQFDRKHEARSATSALSSLAPDVAATLGAMHRDRLFAVVRTELPRFGPQDRWRLTAGIELANRSWKMDGGQVITRDLLPHALLDLPGFGSGLNEDRWGLGWVMSWHRAFGPVELRDRLDKEPAVEQKLLLSYDFRFAKKASIVLLVTGDLDEAFTRKSWDGGSARLRMNF
ncbi:MAG: hypothetical protein NDJ89_09270 [Oligoflexia bacterium]|nr:hypothetical protein [Oligoflexia bacterium]